jgi:hypothetical protein
MGVLGEVSEEVAGQVESALAPHECASSSAIRAQAAAGAAALAAAHPAAASRLLSDALDRLEKTATGEDALTFWSGVWLTQA